ncbi:hypothetical protein [Domibacillus tundrae]|uniref:hypothetical protein n=1 Tax=Domibacillus tundrae TaxID=1587527 RepID=UPI00339A58A6
MKEPVHHTDMLRWRQRRNGTVTMPTVFRKSQPKNGTNIRCSSKKRGEAKRMQTSAESEVLVASSIGPFKKRLTTLSTAGA